MLLGGKHRRHDRLQKDIASTITNTLDITGVLIAITKH